MRLGKYWVYFLLYEIGYLIDELLKCYNISNKCRGKNMLCLNNWVYKLLKVEVDKCVKEDLVGEVGKKIVMKRLDKLWF